MKDTFEDKISEIILTTTEAVATMGSLFTSYLNKIAGRNISIVAAEAWCS
jgi:hypothetical protein